MYDLAQKNDLELLHGWRHGDPGMGAELFDRHKTAVTNLFRRNVRSKADIPDLVQQAFLACLSAKNDPVDVRNVRGYLLGVAFNTMMRFSRKSQRTPKLVTDGGHSGSLASMEPDPEYLLTLGDERRLLMKAIRRLKPQFQVMIELIYWEGITCDAIAEALDIPQGTARRRLQRGRAALAEKLAELADSPELLNATTMSIRAWQQDIQRWISEHSHNA